MSEIPDIDILPQLWRSVHDILLGHVGGHEVRAIGSRARKTAKRHSGLDLLVMSAKVLPLETTAALAEGFSQSDLALKVDVVDRAATSETLRRIIERDSVCVQQAEQRLDAARP